MTAPALGDPAPDFELRDQHGQLVRLSSYRQAKPVVLVFYPAAFSPVCGGELVALRDASPQLEEAGVELLAISCDPMFTLRAFSDQERIEFRMLTDFWPHGAVSESYGVLDRDLGCSRRSTFVLDRSGEVRWLVHHGLPDPRSVEDLLTALEQLTAGQVSRRSRTSP